MLLYPGHAGDGKQFAEYEGFHEMLPGLGAFAIRPRSDGTAEGMGALREFLDAVIDHLANRTTARERVTFHTAESYTLQEQPVEYGGRALAERGELSDTRRALPPAEHHVLVAWFNDAEQLAWTMSKGWVVVRLGDRKGTWTVPPEFATTRHILLHTYGSKVEPGMLRLKETKQGYRVFTAEDLVKNGYPGSAKGDIYAVFEVESDPAFEGQKWDGAKLQQAMASFESRRSYRTVNSLGRLSAHPRVLSLRELLTAMVG